MAFQLFDKSSNEKPSWGGVLTSLAITAYAVYRVFYTDTSTLGRIFFISMLIVGPLLLIAGIIAILAPSREKLAEDGAALDQKLWSGVHQRRSVGAETIRAYGLDQDFYDRTTRALEAEQFRSIGDHVDVTGEQAMPSARGVIRAFLSADGTITAGVFQIRFRGWIRLVQLAGLISRDMRTTDFETELSDGTFVTTLDSPDAAKTVEIPGIVRQLVPRDMSVREKLVAHLELVSRVLSQKPGLYAVTLSSAEDMFASQDRLQLLKSNFRQSAQYNKAAEVESIAGRPLNEREQAWANEVERRKHR